MKLSIIVLLVSFSAFAQLPHSNGMTIIDKNAVYKDTYIGKVDTRDRACFSEIERAQKDFAEDKITYYDYVGHGSRMRSLDFFQSAIEKLNLKYELVMVSCLAGELITENFVPQTDCYQDAMTKLVRNKFGKEFFEKLEEKSDSLYVVANINLVFDSSECDTVIRYKKALGKKYNQQFEDVKHDLDKIIVYPADFKNKKEKSFSYTTCDFTITKEGKVTDLQISSTFQNVYNDKFREYFEKKIRAFVLESEWLPASSHGIPINSEWSVNYWYK